MRLYHFMPTKCALQAIERHRLKVANLNEVNDPYESLAVGFNSHDRQESFLDVSNFISDAFRVICFSELYENPLLWGHYADRCKGICLEFDVTEMVSENRQNFFKKVNYIPERLSFDETDIEFRGFSNENNINVGMGTKSVLKLLINKSHNWEYENEWRLVINRGALETDPVTELLFFHFDGQIELREILIGVRCIEENKDIESRLNKLASQYPNPPEIVRTRRSFSKFEIKKVT